jgi:transaldolase
MGAARPGPARRWPAAVTEENPGETTPLRAGGFLALQPMGHALAGRLATTAAQWPSSATLGRLNFKGNNMNAAKKLHDLGQRLWLDNITRGLLDSGTLARYIRDDAVTGLTSNPTIFEHALGSTDLYDEEIRARSEKGEAGEHLFFGLALADLGRAADLFVPVFQASGGLDGWVSLEVSPLLAADASHTVQAAQALHARAGRPNLYIKVPGTSAGLVAIEESIAAGVPINVTLLFSRTQYLAAAAAYMRGIERRIAAGSDPNVSSVASLFVSRWDVAANAALPESLKNRLGIAIARQAYGAYQGLLASKRWQRLAAAGARPQRLLWASTGTKDPALADTLYVEQLAASGTINTMPEKTLLAWADHGSIGQLLAPQDTDADRVLEQCRQQGVDIDELGARLQQEGADAFVASWRELLGRIASKCPELAQNANR